MITDTPTREALERACSALEHRISFVGPQLDHGGCRIHGSDSLVRLLREGWENDKAALALIRSSLLGIQSEDPAQTKLSLG